MNEWLTELINEGRARGLDDVQISQELLARGVMPDEIRSALSASATYTLVAPQTVSSSKRILLIVGGILFLMFISSMGTFLVINMTSEKPNPMSSNKNSDLKESDSFAKFTDPNFSIDLAKSWGGDAGYEPGAELVMFYSPENNSDSNRDKAASMIMYIGDQPYDRIQAQLDQLIESGGSYETVKDEQVGFGEYKGRMLNFVVTSKEQPDKKIHIISLAVKGKNKQYFIDVASLEEYWYLHEKNVDHMLRSFKPLN